MAIGRRGMILRTTFERPITVELLDRLPAETSYFFSSEDWVAMALDGTLLEVQIWVINGELRAAVRSPSAARTIKDITQFEAELLATLLEVGV